MSAPAEVSAEPGTMGVTRQRSYHLTDDDETEIDKENLLKAFRYGKTLVPVLTPDEQEMKLKTERCLDVLCFVPASSVSNVSLKGVFDLIGYN